MGDYNYITCPHCRGNTKCSCGTCGTQTYRGVNNEGVWEAGLCKVCHGLGKIRDPFEKEDRNK